MDWSERTKNILLSVSAVVIPVVVAILGQQLQTVLKEREVQGRFVEVAVAILKEPASADNRPLRAWATQIVNKYSGVPLSAQTQESLISKLSLPYYGRYEFSKSPDFFTADNFSAASTKSIRSMLAELGYYKGPVSDDLSIETWRATTSALRQFQIDNGLEGTGWPSRETMDELARAVLKKRAANSKKK